MRKAIALMITIIMLLNLISCSKPTQNKVYFEFSEENKINNTTINGNKTEDTEEVPIIPMYKVTYETNGGTYVVSSITSGIVHKEPVTNKENHLFQGWYYDKDFKLKAIFPLGIDDDVTLYAKWLKIYDTKTLSSTKIKDAKNYKSKYTYNITPTGFDIEELKQLGYKATITVSYDVYYKKDYDVILDIGYFGEPKYEVYLHDSSNTGSSRENVKATTYSQTKTISSYFPTNSLESLNYISFTISTNNIQNIIYFENIKVTYECEK